MKQLKFFIVEKKNYDIRRIKPTVKILLNSSDVKVFELSLFN